MHRFSPGALVKIVWEVDESVEGMVIQGSLRYIDVCISGNATDFDYDRLYQLNQTTSPGSRNVIIKALHTFCKHKHSVSKVIRDTILYTYPASVLRISRAAHGIRSPTEYSQHEAGGNSPHIIERVPEVEGAAYVSTDEIDAVVAVKELTSSLNPSQLKALYRAIERPISLIQGPPGTGKTRTACNILSVLVAIEKDRTKTNKILACSHSNVAADNILEGLLRLGMNVVRIGRPAKVRSALRKYTLDGMLDTDPELLLARQNYYKARSCWSRVSTSST